MNWTRYIDSAEETSVFQIVIALVLVLTTIFGQIPGDTLYSAVLQNSCHFPVFFILAWIVFNLFRTYRQRYWKAFLVCLTIGIGIELIQGVLGGDASIYDVFSDTAGISASLSWRALRSAQISRAYAIGVLMGCGVYWIAPMVWCGAAYLNRAVEYPTLASFHSSIDLYFFKDTNDRPEIKLIPRVWEKGGGEEGLFLSLPHSRWPGVELSEPSPNWLGFGWLNLDLINPNDVTLKLTLRVNDREHNQAFDDRFNASLAIAPVSRSTFRFPLSEILHAPRGRLMNLRQMRNIIVFGSADVAGKTIYLNRIWLD